MPKEVPQQKISQPKHDEYTKEDMERELEREKEIREELEPYIRAEVDTEIRKKVKNGELELPEAEINQKIEWLKKNKSYASYSEEKLREIAEDETLREMIDAETEERIEKKLD